MNDEPKLLEPKITHKATPIHDRDWYWKNKRKPIYGNVKVWDAAVSIIAAFFKPSFYPKGWKKQCRGFPGKNNPLRKK